MLSRRDKLLIQPWEHRRFKDHRAKVRAAAPAVEARAPAPRPHVALQCGRRQRERERAAHVRRDNVRLLQRLAAAMRRRRPDYYWDKPLPNFQHKVGLFYDARSLNNKILARTAMEESSDNSYNNVKCYACEMKKKKYEFKGSAKNQDFLPPIHSR